MDCVAQHARSDSGSSMESLDLEVESLEKFHGKHLDRKSKSVDGRTGGKLSHGEHTRAKTLNELQLDQLGICERVDSSDDEGTSDIDMQDASPVSPTTPPKAARAKSSFAEMRSRMRSKPLALSGISAMPEWLSSPMSSEEDNGNSCCSGATKRSSPNGLRRSRCLRLNFDQLLPSQDFLFNKGNACTARKRADTLTKELSKLRSYLYIGDVKAAQNTRKLKAKGITHIVNLAGATCCNFAEDDFSYLTLTPTDCESEDLSSLFLPIACFIDGARAVGGKVLIHCYRGVSRSCAAALSYIMLDEGKTFSQAWMDLRRVRPVASPNRGFMTALVALEKLQRHGTDRHRIWRLNLQHENVAVMKRLYGVPNAFSARNEVLLLEKPNRRGMKVYRGCQTSDAWWDIFMPLIDRFAEQIAKNRVHYPCPFGRDRKLEIDSVEENQMLQW